MLLLLCSGIVETPKKNRNRRIVIRAEKLLNKRVSERKQNNSTDEALIVKTKSGDLTHLPSAVVVDYVII